MTDTKLETNVMEVDELRELKLMDSIIELDTKSFAETIKSSEKLVVVEFYSNTCPQCAAIAPVS